MTDLIPDPIFDPDKYSNRYKNALAVVFVLFLALLTSTILLIILSSSSRRNLEEEYELTLTAVMTDITQQKTAIAITPTPVPRPIAGHYPFQLHNESVTFTASGDCTQQVVSGHVLNTAGDPVDGLQVLIWGDYTPAQIGQTGRVAGLPTGSWQVNLPGTINRRLWVQLTDGARFLSDPVEFIFERENCAQNQAAITFIEIGD